MRGWTAEQVPTRARRAAWHTPRLDADLALIQRICRDDPEALDLLDRVTQQKDGRPPKTVDNVHVTKPDGNTSAAALRRLRDKHPEIHQRVLAGELSVTAAAVDVGSYPKRICRDDPQALDLLDRVTQGRQGERTDLLYSVQDVAHTEAPAGNTSAAALRRLRKDRPDLHEHILPVCCTVARNNALIYL